MTITSPELVAQIATGAAQYLDNPDEDQLFNDAAQRWANISAERTQVRPILPEINKFLRDVVRDVVRDITRKYSELTVVTLSVVTEQLVTHLTQNLGWGDLNQYAIPLEILAAIVYNMILKELKKRT